jgi:Na+/phosphate symporter
MIGDNPSMSAQRQLLAAMPVGDPRRPLIGRAAFGTLMASAIFFVFMATKQIKPMYHHAPWENDPYDTAFSFTMFFVPLIAAYLLVQVSLCRKAEPLSVSRTVAILRGCRVAVGAIVVEMATAWVAVAVRANRSHWTSDATGLLVALLFLSTITTGKVIIDLRRAPRLQSPNRTDACATAARAQR